MKKLIGFLTFFTLFFLSAKPVSAIVNFRLEPASETIGVGETTQVNIVLNTDTASTGAISVILSFDPDKLSDGASLIPGVFSLVLVNSVDNSLGSIRFDAGSSANQSGDNILVATINFTGETAGTAAVSFNEARAVDAETNQYLPTSSTGGSYIVTAAGGPEPTATSTPTKTPTPTRTPTPGNGVVPTSTPTISPEEVPETGILTPTFLFLIAGVVFFTFGFFALLP